MTDIQRGRESSGQGAASSTPSGAVYDVEENDVQQRKHFLPAFCQTGRKYVCEEISWRRIQAGVLEPDVEASSEGPKSWLTVMMELSM